MASMQTAVSWFTQQPPRAFQYVLWLPCWFRRGSRTKRCRLFIDEGSLLDSSGNSRAGLGNMDSYVTVAEQVIVPNGAVIFPAGEVSTMTTIVISFNVSVALADENTYLVFPGDSEIRWILLLLSSFSERGSSFLISRTI